MRSLPEGTTAMGLPVAMGAYIYTFIFVTVPSLASVFNEYALKSHYDTSIYLQNLFLYGYGAIFNFLGIFGTIIIKGPENFDIMQGHSKATMLLIINNAGQGILSSFFFNHADTILKKYSSTVATIFTGFASAALFGHTLTINFLLRISIVFTSMHQFFSPLSKVKEEENRVIQLEPVQSNDRVKVQAYGLLVETLVVLFIIFLKGVKLHIHQHKPAAMEVLLVFITTTTTTTLHDQ